jgi:hypothetical protein
MAKIKAPDATMTQMGPGMYKARFFNPKKFDKDEAGTPINHPEVGIPGNWDEISYIDGWAQAKMGMEARKSRGYAFFNRLILKNGDGGKY